MALGKGNDLSALLKPGLAQSLGYSTWLSQLLNGCKAPHKCWYSHEAEILTIQNQHEQELQLTKELIVAGDKETTTKLVLQFLEEPKLTTYSLDFHNSIFKNPGSLLAKAAQLDAVQLVDIGGEYLVPPDFIADIARDITESKKLYGKKITLDEIYKQYVEAAEWKSKFIDNPNNHPLVSAHTTPPAVDIKMYPGMIIPVEPGDVFKYTKPVVP